MSELTTSTGEKVKVDAWEVDFIQTTQVSTRGMPRHERHEQAIAKLFLAGNETSLRVGDTITTTLDKYGRPNVKLDKCFVCELQPANWEVEYGVWADGFEVTVQTTSFTWLA